jgi:ketosteroid isomerase-like protein
MRLIRTPIVAGAALLLLAAAEGSAQHVPGAPVTDWDRTRREYTIAVLRDYNSVMSEWRERLSGGEAAKAADYYADGAVLMVSGEAPVQGRDSIRAWLVRTAPNFVDLRTALSDFVASDNLAFATGPVAYTFRESGSVAQKTIAGHHVTVLVRENRRWRIRSQVLKYDQEPATGQ